MIAADFLAMTRKYYKAIALVQIGRVGWIDQIARIGMTPIESPHWVIERIIFLTFKDVMIWKISWLGRRGGMVKLTIESLERELQAILDELRQTGKILANLARKA